MRFATRFPLSLTRHALVSVSGFAWIPPASLGPQSSKRVASAFSVTPSLHIRVQESPPAFHPLRLSPRVRSRLTQGGRTFPWNPWAFGVQDSHLHLATHTGILLSSMLSICRLRHTSSCMQRSPTTYTSIYIRSFGTWLKPRYIFGAGPLD